MASWDTPAVAAPTTANYAPPVQDFSSIANLVQDFAKGRQMGREEDKANLFRNGIPRVGGGTTGDYDLDKIATDTARVGGADYAKPFMDMQLASQRARVGQQATDDADRLAAGGQPSGAAPIAHGAPKTAPGAAPAQPTTSAAASKPATVMTILAAQGVPNDQLQAASESVSSQLGIGPNDPVNTQDPQVRNVLVPALQRLKGIGQVVSPAAQPAVPASAPQSAPQATPADRVAQGFDAASPSRPGPAQLQAQADRYGLAESHMTKQAIAAAALGDAKSAEEMKAKAGYYHDLQKGVLDQISKANEPTGNQKDYEYAVAHGFKGSPDEWASQAEADKATAGERAKSDVKEQNEYIAAGKQAGNRLTTLNTIGNIVNSDNNLTLGFGADTALKIKMALKQLGVPVGDLSGAEGIQKMNAALASEMAKSLSGRPTQFEFKSFMANNPGLLLDKTGNQRLIGIYSQLAKREYELGKQARQNADNWSNWDNVVEQYDAKHPIIDPISKQPISTNSVVAPGPQGKAAPSPAAPAQEGAMAINPKTGERLKLQGGKWVPFA